ncbi:MAG: metallophosphoesterase [Puniceicoccaceae bacterium]
MTAPDQEWTFIHVTDMHIGTPRSYRFQPAWNANWQTARRQILDLQPELLLVGGDMTRDGATHRFELEQAKQELDALPFPWYAIPGNHEVGNKFRLGDPVSVQPRYLDNYRSVFGPSAWSFVHRNVQFSAFDAFLAGSGLSEEMEMWQWMDNVERDPSAQYHVWMMHPALFIDRIDEPNWNVETDRNAWYFGVDEPYRSRMLATFQRTRADLVITGHIHCRRRIEVEGIVFQLAPSTAFPQWGDRWPDGDDTLGFLRFRVTSSGIQEAFIPLDADSKLEGYGPGGNPPVQGRDYSVAWEKPPLQADFTD